MSETKSIVKGVPDLFFKGGIVLPTPQGNVFVKCYRCDYRVIVRAWSDLDDQVRIDVALDDEMFYQSCVRPYDVIVDAFKCAAARAHDLPRVYEPYVQCLSDDNALIDSAYESVMQSSAYLRRV